MGISVFLTNPNPDKIPDLALTTRANLANDYWLKNGKPKAIFISLHANAYSNSSARGTETFHAKNASLTSKDFAKILQKEIFTEMKKLDNSCKDRGVKQENFTVIQKASMPSVLVEYGFYTNLDDLKILKNYRNNLVESTVRAICTYFGVKYSVQTSTPPTSQSTNQNKMYKVCVGAYKDKSNADKALVDAKAKGFNSAYIIYE